MEDDNYHESASEAGEEMSMSPTVKRALCLAAVLGGVELGLGSLNGSMNVTMAASDAALIGVSSVASGSIHRIFPMEESCAMSAAMTAAVYTGGKAVMGSPNLIMDFLLSAAVSYGTECVAAKMMN